MPKCKVCGKGFDSLSALRDHHNSVHRNTRLVAPKTSFTRNFLLIVTLVIIVSGSLIGYVIYIQIHSPQATCTLSQTTSLDMLSNTPFIQTLAQDQSSSQIGQPIGSTLIQQLTSVSNTTLSSIGSGSGVTSPSKICGDALVSNGKPLVFYVGGDFCPFCAAERWSMVVALSKFGSFSNLTYMISWANESPGYQNISTVSFNYASYSSKYISFLGIEEFNRDRQVQNQLNSSEQALVTKYDSSGSIPFIDIANNYTVVGSQFSPPTLSGLTWDQIGAQLDNPSSTIAKSIDGGANTLITAICKSDGGLPTNVCSQSYSNLNLVYGVAHSTTPFQLGMVDNAGSSRLDVNEA